MEIQFLSDAENTDVAIVVGVFEDKELSSAAAFLDETTGGFIKTALKHNRFRGKLGETLMLIAPNDLKVNRILLAGFGKRDAVTAVSLQEVGGYVYAALENTPDKEVVLHLGDMSINAFDKADVATNVSFGFDLRSWHWDKYQTKKKPEEKPQIEKLTVITDDADAAQKAYEPMRALVEGINACRALQSEPGNILHPDSYPDFVKETLDGLDIGIEVLGEKEMKKLGMGALLGVGQGSIHESKLVIMTYNNGPKEQDPLAFIGKGVTFDSGGISLKPGPKMEEMIYDMSGSSAVVGLMKTLALRKAKVNVVGVIGIVENMPGGNAQRPGDVVKTMSGQTVEVLNTDAEGRLVLADALWYTQERFKPQFMINLATLTGAILIALGSEYAGLFSNNDDLAEKLFKAGKETGDNLWRLPMNEGYNKMLNTTHADMQNISNGRMAGSITAAQFLERFVNGLPWAHLDIAGTAWVTDRQLPNFEKGATAMGVRVLNKLVQDYYEAA